MPGKTIKLKFHPALSQLIDNHGIPICCKSFVSGEYVIVNVYPLTRNFENTYILIYTLLRIIHAGIKVQFRYSKNANSDKL